MNNSNALAEIQSKYPNCNLLLPAATSVQINPFYKNHLYSYYTKSNKTY